MDLQLAGHVVIVTGAASSIGAATASQLSAEGAIVVGVDRNPMPAPPAGSMVVAGADRTVRIAPRRGPGDRVPGFSSVPTGYGRRMAG